MTHQQPDPPLLSFPCRFPIKAVGRDDGQFLQQVSAIVRRHIPDLPESALRTRASGAGNYLAVTITIDAQSQAQLDQIYRDLSACEQVLMAL